MVTGFLVHRFPCQVWPQPSCQCSSLFFFPGVVATGKAVISEVSDDSNQAFGLSLLGVAFGTAYILGPAVAGVIADPIGQYNLTITGKLLTALYMVRVII